MSKTVRDVCACCVQEGGIFLVEISVDVCLLTKNVILFREFVSIFRDNACDCVV